MNKFTQTESLPQVQHPSYSDRQFMHTLLAGVVLPLAQAAVTAAMVMLSLVVIMYLLDAIDVFKFPVIAGVITLVGMWLFLQRRWLSITNLERVTGIDINRDGVVGEPAKKVHIIVDKVKDDEHIEQMDHTFPVSEQQIELFFSTVKTSTRGGKSISRRKWTPKNINGFSEGEWDAFFAELVKQKLVTIKGNECVLTSDGEEIADGWYQRANIPSPTDEEAPNP